ncbi:MAG TPA: serine/threonine dehydratase [Vineibacter sp.]|nr:serine/threonine dehydratase [Vineibacter sp.]
MPDAATATPILSPDAVAAAYVRIKPHVRHTPVIDLPAGAFGLANRLALKLESLQHSGSFKGRGAFHKLLLRPPGPAGVIAASGGNHGAAVAYAARALGHRAEIFVPTIAAPAKVERLKSYGASVHQVGAVYAEARAASEARAAETGAQTVAAYDDPEVFVGAGTTALEFELQSAFDTLLVAVGGGGLIAGCALWCGARTRVIAVETDGTPTLHAALAAGQPVDVAISGLAADALGASRIGAPNFEIARRLVAGSVLVSDDAVRAAQRALWTELRIMAEPAGAAGLAALLSGAYKPSPAEKTGILVCGANLDPASLG